MLRLSDSLKKQVPLTQAQVEKFGNYLLSRKTVQSAKGVACLIETTKALAGMLFLHNVVTRKRLCAMHTFAPIVAAPLLLCNEISDLSFLYIVFRYQNVPSLY